METNFKKKNMVFAKLEIILNNIKLKNTPYVEHMT